MDMREAGRSLEPGFGLVYCIGNSLVHLESEEAIGALLAGCRGLLEQGTPAGGADHPLRPDPLPAAPGLPTLVSEKPPLRFARRYDYSEGDRVVQFRTELTVQEPSGPRTLANSVALRILKREALEKLTRAAGFRHLELHGGFGGERSGLDSLPLILCARQE